MTTNGLVADLLPSKGDWESSSLEWKVHYRGVLRVACLGGVPLAGLSGPWPGGQYALIWWGRKVPDREAEVFDSIEAAQRRVEEWVDDFTEERRALRRAANDPDAEVRDGHGSHGWSDRLWRRLSGTADRASGHRQPSGLSDAELASMHFRAID